MCVLCYVRVSIRTIYFHCATKNHRVPIYNFLVYIISFCTLITAIICRISNSVYAGKCSHYVQIISSRTTALFLTFINDLPEVTNSEARLFAVDCLLYRPIVSRKDTEDLQQDLAALEDWEKQWQMAFHPEKCVVIQISSKRSTISANYTLYNHQLDVVESSKHLGVTINKNLRWDDHINNTTARANRTLGFLKRNIRGCKTSARARAYEAIVRPTLEYAAYIWDPYNTGQINQLEKVETIGTIYHQELHKQTARKCHSDGNPTWMGTTPG